MLSALRKGSDRKMSVASNGTMTGSTKRDSSDKSSTDGSRISMPGLNLRGLLAAKRLTRNLKLRSTARQLKGSSWMSFSDRPRAKSTISAPRITLQPTYKLEPDHPFVTHEGQIYHMMSSRIANRFDGVKYDSRLCAEQSRLLSDEIKEWIKELGIERYKIIVVVNVGETDKIDVSISSRAVWDSQFDTFISYEYRNPSLFCVATVYGVYAE
ncbi:dynein light chain Tctex-type 5-A-like [Saccoglossus kowalevskii]|uniref:Tctex1 domain-containing protein 1-A-like n=1 Tax=Saccoglossus kowalevskii TaxID=10224 RepID=A0ABM0MWC5_SACKO|nr:PREDICTED: tctex1 domain-containing protein 1-A-like [Saccoglossus kowalevskii]